MKNIVIFGAPGSGKGTQSDLMIEKYGFNHISLQEIYSVQTSRTEQNLARLPRVLSTTDSSSQTS